MSGNKQSLDSCLDFINSLWRQFACVLPTFPNVTQVSPGNNGWLQCNADNGTLVLSGQGGLPSVSGFLHSPAGIGKGASRGNLVFP